jgi:hypothetical protein
MKGSVSWDIISCSLEKVNQCLFETSVDFHQATRCYTSDNRSLHVSIRLSDCLSVHLFSCLSEHRKHNKMRFKRS